MLSDIGFALAIIITSVTITLQGERIRNLENSLREIKQSKVTLICDNYKFKQSLNQAMAKDCYVVKGGERDGI